MEEPVIRQTTYEVVDIQTGQVVKAIMRVSERDARKRARRAADRMDAAYGAVRYIIRQKRQA